MPTNTQRHEPAQLLAHRPFSWSVSSSSSFLVSQLKFAELRKGEKPSKSSIAYLESWESVTQPVVDAVIPALKAKFWDDLSPRLYVSFWMLSPYDLEVPKSSYDREVDRLKATEDNKDQPAKKKKEIERGRLLQEKLLEEQLKQDEHVRRVRSRLEKEKDAWFQSSKLLLILLEMLKLIAILLLRCSQGGDDDSVLSALPLSSLHLHRQRCSLLRQVCPPSAHAQNAQLLYAYLLR